MYKINFVIITFLLTLFSANIMAKLEQKAEALTKEIAVNDKININKLTAEELAQKLIGIGLKKARNIVDYRKTYGDFIAVEQLLEVKGIGKAIFEKNKHLLTIID